MAELVQMGSFITASERETAQVLRELPASWLVICNKDLVAPSGVTYEVDFIVVGNHLIYVVDEKSWRGPIYGNENVWILSGNESRPNPLRKIGHVARQLAGRLRGRVPYLHDLEPGVHFVYELVLLSSPNTELRVADPRAPTHVLRSSEVVDDLQRIDRENDRLDLALARATIQGELTDLPNRPQFPRVINA